LLENEELYNTLDMSKAKCTEIENELETMRITLEGVEKVRDNLRPVSKRVSRLFFCIADLANVDPMYQYSLKWFTSIFEKSIDRVEKSDAKNPSNQEKKERIVNLINSFTDLLYSNVCRSLFSKDKLLFSFLLCMKIMEERDELDTLEKRFVMTGGTWVESSRPNPTGDNGWLLHKSWYTIQEMASKIEAFKGFDIEFE
jgi:dynein heavy chain